MIPAAVVPMDALPRLPNGKTHVRSLASSALDVPLAAAGGGEAAGRLAEQIAKYGSMEAFLASGDATQLAESGTLLRPHAHPWRQSPGLAGLPWGVGAAWDPTSPHVIPPMRPHRVWLM
jgi:hypothetical protein